MGGIGGIGGIDTAAAGDGATDATDATDSTEAGLRGGPLATADAGEAATSMTLSAFQNQSSKAFEYKFHISRQKHLRFC